MSAKPAPEVVAQIGQSLAALRTETSYEPAVDILYDDTNHRWPAQVHSTSDKGKAPPNSLVAPSISATTRW